MTTMKQEPLNFKLTRVTPKWAFKQQARRILVLTLAASPIALGILPIIVPQTFVYFFAPLLLIPILCFVWLIGATYARADSPDEYLDEREIVVRNEVYLDSFRIIGAIIALGFIVFTIFPDTRIDAKTVFYLLFPISMFLPTCVLAWKQPDPLEE